MSYVIYSDELYHHGIKGMRWGVRRFQNYDGTRTASGKRREKTYNLSYPDAPEKKSKGNSLRTAGKVKSALETSGKAVDAMKKIEKASYPKAPEKKRPDLSKMTDEELRKKISREQLERTYTSLFVPQPAPQVSKGRQRVHDILDVSGDVLAVGTSVATLYLVLKGKKI